MAAPMDSDEEDSFVTLGTPLEVFEDDEARKKPVSVHDLPAKDNRGRPRFHGAFTGGFSAGFFNTVGSKEGFQPASFVSSRSAKEEKVQQRPEDFMDDEDFSEHGIAPRKLAASSTYTSTERGLKRKAMAVAAAGSCIIPGAAAALTDLIVPESLPIGVQLLRKMGWKEGQGIGPRERRKKKTKGRTKPEERIIGCALPPSDDSDEELDEVLLKDVTFAPKDKNPVSLKAKDNVHGLGYSGLDPKSALPSAHINLFQTPPVKGKGQKGIKGQAFGVGALEDEDDDIYAVDHLSNYDMTMGLEDEDNKFGWTAPGQNRKGKQRVPIGYIGKLLEGFQLSSISLKKKKVFKPPVLPAAFRPVHRFLRPCDNLTPTTDTEKHNAVSRGIVLGETPIFKSVFDLIPKDDLKKVEKSKERHGLGPQPMSTPQSSSNHHRTSRFSAPVPVSDSNNIETDRQTEPVSHQTPIAGESSSSPSKSLFQGSRSFQPFARDPAKQGRYDKYISLLKHGNADPYEEVVEGHMTEWEREREKEEFVRAAKLYKPLSAMMATRFTTAKFADDQDKVDVPAESESQKSDQAKAVEMKMFGRLTRDECDWYPDKLLCRRFNVPNPYPGSTIVGLPTVKRDKYSVFNFLEFPGSQTAGEPDQVPAPALEYPDPPVQEPSTSAQPAKNPTIKSFTVGSSKPGGGRPALGSIFSVLYEDDEKKKKAKQSHMEEEKIPDSVTTQERQPTSDNLVPTSESPAENNDVPSLDLFRAIFKNSDSEDASSASEKEQEEEQTATPITMDTGGGGDTGSGGLNQENSQVKSDMGSPAQHLPGAPVAVETLEERLTAPVSDKPQSDDTMAYGPALPPPSTSATTSSTARSSPVIDLTYSAHRKQKHKHKVKERRKHKHKKEKKTKNKKSKHKRKEKKKKEQQRKSSSDDDDSESSDSESDERQPSDQELLNRLKAFGGRRLKAADFM